MWRIRKIKDTLRWWGGPHNLDSSILGSILGSPYLENYHIGSCRIIFKNRIYSSLISPRCARRYLIASGFGV